MAIDDLYEKYEKDKNKAIVKDMIDISRKYTKSKKETTKAKYREEIKNLEALSRRLPYEVLVNMYGFPEKIYGPFPDFDYEEDIGGYTVYHRVGKKVDDKIIKLIRKSIDTFPISVMENGGYIVGNKFIPKNLYESIAKIEIKNKIDEIKIKGFEALSNPSTQMAEKKMTISELTESYIADVLEKKKSTKDSRSRYVKNLNDFSKFTKKEYIYDITYQDGLSFQERLRKSVSEKTVNNIIGQIKKVFKYAEERGHINSSPINAIHHYKVDNKKTNKRNFTMEELEQIFEGKKIKDKAALDVLRFLLFTGMRADEFMKLDDDSFYKKFDHTWVKIHTSKQKVDGAKINNQEKEFYRTVPLHPSIEYLGNYAWIAKFKKKHRTKNAIQSKLNREIDKVVKDTDVSLHRLRGNFANIVDEHLMTLGFKDMQDHTKDLLGHAKNNFLHKDDVGKFSLTKSILGEFHDLSQDSYALSGYAHPKIAAINGFDSLLHIFKYRK